jgi:hypothetical protein
MLPPLTYPEQTVTTLTSPAVFIDPRTDFVSTDTAALPTEASTLRRRRLVRACLDVTLATSASQARVWVKT